MTISAKASPSAVVPAPQASARNSVFHATPQRPPPVRQRRLQIFSAASRSISSAGMKAPSPSWKACSRMRRIGQAVNSTIEAATVVTAPATKASPPKPPRSRQADRQQRQQGDQHQRAAGPMPTWRASSSPNSGVEPVRGPAAQADAERLGDEQDEADAACQQQAGCLAARARAGRSATARQATSASQHGCQPPLALREESGRGPKRSPPTTTGRLSQTPESRPSCSAYQGSTTAASRPATDHARRRREASSYGFGSAPTSLSHRAIRRLRSADLPYLAWS